MNTQSIFNNPSRLDILNERFEKIIHTDTREKLFVNRQKEQEPVGPNYFLVGGPYGKYSPS